VKIQSSVRVNVMQMSLLGRRVREKRARAGAAFEYFLQIFGSLSQTSSNLIKYPFLGITKPQFEEKFCGENPQRRDKGS